ncbi:cytochrome P450 [Marasmius fiardii PR-910]|nr:cytochrome P450 [Marasmius fiardii PR-910]
MSTVRSIVNIFLLSFATGVLALVIRAKRKSLKFLRGPPTPSWLLGYEFALIGLRKVGEPDGNWTRDYGYAFRVPGCYGEDVLMVSDPKALQHIIHKSAYRYPKAKDTNQLFHKLFGPGLATVTGEAHQRQRKILNPSFSAAQIKSFAEVFGACATILTRKWRDQIEADVSSGRGRSTTIDTIRWLPNLALDAIGNSMFDYEFGALEGKRESTLCAVLANVFLDRNASTKADVLRNAAYRFLPSSILNLKRSKMDRRFARCQKAIMDVANELVKMKMDSVGLEGKNDLFSNSNDISQLVFDTARAMSSSIPDQSMSQVEGLSQMATFIFAGHETTAATMSWILYELTKHPKEQEMIFQDIKNVREDTGNESGPLSVRDLEGPGMAHLNRVIRETLRYHTIAPEIFRQAGTDDVIPLDYPIVDASGSVLKEIPVVQGQKIHVNIYQYNRVKELWGEDADVWNPDRFLDYHKPTTLGMYGNLMTFSGGVRGCIGWRFAMLEMQVVLTALIESFVFSLPDGVDIDQVSPGAGTAFVKGRWEEGPQMPLTVAQRAI